MMSAARYIFLLSIVFLAGCIEQREPLPINTRLGGEFTLTDQYSNAFHSSQLEGRPTLLFFGFTECPDICPAVLAQMGQTNRAMAEQGLANRVNQVFITFDPERDTPEHLREYLPWFNEHLIGLTGTPEEIEAVAAQFGVVYLLDEMEDGDYSFSHSDFIYLLDDQNRVRKLYPANFDPKEVIADVKTLL